MLDAAQGSKYAQGPEETPAEPGGATRGSTCPRRVADVSGLVFWSASLHAVAACTEITTTKKLKQSSSRQRPPEKPRPLVERRRLAVADDDEIRARGDDAGAVAVAQRPVVRVRPDGVRRRADGARLRVQTPVLRDDAAHRVFADRASDDEAPVPRQQKQLGLSPLAQTAARRRAGPARRDGRNNKGLRRY